MKLVHIDSFQDPCTYMVKVDFFQDHLEEFWKLVQIDSFQDPHLYQQKLTHFKTIVHSNKIGFFQDHHKGYTVKPSGIDSFQDHLFICSTKWSPFKIITLDYIMFHSPWETPFWKLLLARQPYTVYSGLISRPSYDCTVK